MNIDNKTRVLLAAVSILLLAATAGAQLDGTDGDRQVYIVLEDPGSEIDLDHLEELGVEVVFDYTIIDGMAVEATPAAAQSMESFDSIGSITPDIPVFLPVMEGDGDDTDRDSYGGSGTVAVLDTGVDDDHVDLEGQVISHEDVRSDGDDPEDYHGHGTHVSSILAGTGEGNPEYAGVAPEARIRNYKVLDDAGSGDMSDVIKGVEEAAEDSDVIVLSLGAEVDECDGTDPLSRAVDSAAGNGVAVVVAAGNEGPDGRTVTSPGCADDAFTVGASVRSENVADYSSRGPTADGRVKPDIVAQGSNIMAAEAQTSSAYTSKSGTSMSAPYVAGAVAALMGEEPGESSEDYYTAMTETAFSLGEPSNTEGDGNVDIEAAIDYMQGDGSGGDTPGGDGGSDGDDTRGDTGGDPETPATSAILQLLADLIEFIKGLMG